MAILICELCNNTQDFYEFGRPLERDAQGRIVREAAWTFDSQTGRCVSDGGREPRYHMCFNCSQRGMWVYSTEPPAASTWTPSAAQRARHEAAAVEYASQEGAPQHVWKVGLEDADVRAAATLAQLPVVAVEGVPRATA
ncbi:unnamed protein product [Peniophora sp. CBMAI 1063]|nr:unnamed protein product [Peniophora sp. CBMAI 1063]